MVQSLPRPGCVVMETTYFAVFVHLGCLALGLNSHVNTLCLTFFSFSKIVSFQICIDY